MSVCLRIFDPETKTADTIGTREGRFDVSERQKDDGANCGVISAPWHVTRAVPWKIAKNILSELQARPMNRHHSNLVYQ